MIGIIGAMEEEVEILKNKLVGIDEIKIAHTQFYTGTLNGRDVVLKQSGIGKVNAAISTSLLIQTFKPDYILNTGSAGALSEDLNVGDVVVSTEVRHHDVDATAFGYVLGQVPGMPDAYVANERLQRIATEIIEAESMTGKMGLVVSGDSFIGRTEQKQQITTHFNTALAVEMEAAAIAQTAYQFDVPFIILRAISDLANGEADVSFEAFLEKAAVSSSAIVTRFVEKL